MDPLLNIEQIECRYDTNVITHDVSFHVNKGDICCLLGPSGCGKTTILRAIAGFQPIYKGAINLDNQIISHAQHITPPEQRRIGMVFQDYALFPHLTLGENIAFGLRKHSRQAQRKVTDRMLELVNLEGYAKRYPHEISGGQQQRVALARALAPEPVLLLMDEPFSNLDVELRKSLSLEVRDILKEQGTSAIMVTHDQAEAFAVSDLVGVIHKGRIQQWDTPYNLYHEPLNRFVANFVGQGYFIPGQVVAPDTVTTEMGVIRGNRAYNWNTGTTVDVLLRADDIVYDPDSSIQAEIKRKTFAGASTLYKLQLPSGQLVESLFTSHLDHAVGDQVPVRINVDHLVAFSQSDH